MHAAEIPLLRRLEWELLLTSLSEGDSLFSKCQPAGADSDLAVLVQLVKLVRAGQYLEVFESQIAAQMLPLPCDTSSLRVGPQRPNEVLEEAQQYYDALRKRVSDYLEAGAMSQRVYGIGCATQYIICSVSMMVF
jgi:hypothetical protein